MVGEDRGCFAKAGRNAAGVETGPRRRGGPGRHVLLCKTWRRPPLRDAAVASNMVVFSFGLVPAQAFRAPEIPSRRDGSENGNNRRIKLGFWFASSIRFKARALFRRRVRRNSGAHRKVRRTRGFAPHTREPGSHGSWGICGTCGTRSGSRAQDFATLVIRNPNCHAVDLRGI